MSMVLTVQTEREILDGWITDIGENLTLKLYTNNVDPAQTDTAGTYTEATGGGYAAKTLTAGTWGAAATDGSSVTTKAYAEQTFSLTGTIGTVYGYFVVGATDGLLRFAEKSWASGYATPSGVSDIKVTPTLTAQSIA